MKHGSKLIRAERRKILDYIYQEMLWSFITASAVERETFNDMPTIVVFTIRLQYD